MDFTFPYLGLGIFLADFSTVAQFSFWGNYLPAAYPVHLRGTGESFAANIGGRMIGTMFAGVTQYLALLSFVPGATPRRKQPYVAAGVAGNIVLYQLCPVVLPAGTEAGSRMKTGSSCVIP